jgi:hypothetical protein
MPKELSDCEIAHALAVVYQAIDERKPSDLAYAHADALRNDLLGVDDIEPLLESDSGHCR